MATKILIVDDSATTRKIISNELKDEGYELHEAENGRKAIEKAENIRPHLITIDVDMPEMNGYEAVDKIRNELQLKNEEGDKEIPIIFITSNDTIEERQKGFEVGASDFILKPFTKGEVVNSIRNRLKPEGNLQGMNALVAEDSRLTRNIIDSILKAEGVNTLLAENGMEAFEIMKEEGQNIDLVMTDYMMPKLDGDKLCQKIRSELGNRSVPIIIISAMTESSSMLDLFKVGASDYIVKPFAKEELLARVRVHFETRALNKQLEQQVLQLKRLNKLKDDFLSITSHDLRSPLSGILGFTDLVMQDKALTETNRGYLKNVIDSGDFLLNLINDILDLGRVQSENHELLMLPLSVKDLLESSLNTVRHMASPKGITLITEDKCKEPPIISGDKNALIRIFNNLLSNAIKFTSKGGKIRQVIKKTKDNRLSISIIDNGIGIPSDKIPFLFDKFSKASRPGTAGEKSTGLGLSITKELIERHDGTVEVTSVEQKGTVFRLLFPLEDKKDHHPLENKDESDSEIRGVQVLIADDNQMNIKLSHMVMTKKGHDVMTAENGKQAFELFLKSIQEDETPFDIIFMDIRMPVMDGLEATAQIRKYEADNGLAPIPIIALTAEIGDEWKNKALEKGLDGFVSKPININQMQEIIQQFSRKKKTQLPVCRRQ